MVHHKREEKNKKGNEDDEEKRVFVPVSSSVQTNLASNCGREERKSQKNVTPVVLDDFFLGLSRTNWMSV